MGSVFARVRLTEELSQLVVSRRVLAEAGGLEEDVKILVDHRHDVALGADIDTEEPHLILERRLAVSGPTHVFARTARDDGPPRDTVRVPGKGGRRRSVRRAWKLWKSRDDSAACCPTRLGDRLHDSHLWP